MFSIVAEDLVDIGVDLELAPGDFLESTSSRIRTEAHGRRVNFHEGRPGTNPFLLLFWREWCEIILFDVRHDADREVSSDASAQLDECEIAMLRRLHIPCGQALHVSEGVLDNVGVYRMRILELFEAFMGMSIAVICKDIPHGGVLGSGNANFHSVFPRLVEPALLKFWISFDRNQVPLEEHEEVLMPEVLFTLFFSFPPKFLKRGKKHADRFILGEEGIGDPPETGVIEFFFLGPSQTLIIRDVRVMFICHEAVQAFFQVSARDGDACDEAGTDEVTEHNAHLKRRTRTSHTQEEFSTIRTEVLEPKASIDGPTAVAVTLGVHEEVRDGCFGGGNIFAFPEDDFLLQSSTQAGDFFASADEFAHNELLFGSPAYRRDEKKRICFCKNSKKSFLERMSYMKFTRKVKLFHRDFVISQIFKNKRNIMDIFFTTSILFPLQNILKFCEWESIE